MVSAGRLCTGAAFAVKGVFFLILEKAVIEASVSVAARPWPAFNSLFSSSGMGKSHSPDF